MIFASTAIQPPFEVLPSLPEGQAKTNDSNFRLLREEIAQLVWAGSTSTAKMERRQIAETRNATNSVDIPIARLASDEYYFVAPDAKTIKVMSGGSLFLGSPMIGDLEELQNNAPRPPGWLDDINSRIYRFSLLDGSWDSYRAKRISRDSIRRANRVAGLLAELVSREGLSLTESPFVAPMSSGGVLFEIKNGDRELQIEIDPTSPDRYEVYRMSSAPSAQAADGDGPVTDSQLRGVLSWIVQPGS